MKKNYIISIVIILLIMIGIGYAYLETDLKINSSIHLKEISISRISLDNLIKLNSNIKVNSTTPDFSKASVSQEYYNSLSSKENYIVDTGIYKSYDDYGDTYYFRGSVENNYVKFANFYWRIVRINGDGSYRLIYDGTEAHANGESSTDRQIGTSAFNESYNDNAYVGYMYGTPASDTYEATHANTNNSTIKTYLDNWYTTNILKYKEYISDTEFCNDRSITDTTYNKGYGANSTYYAASERIGVTKKTQPVLTCTNKNDRFTVSDIEVGNGALSYPIGLLTADEASMAGGIYYKNDGAASNLSYYLYTGSYYWTCTPYRFDNSSFINYINYTGYFNTSNPINKKFGVKPVINIKPNTIKRGTGIMTDPFIVE